MADISRLSRFVAGLPHDVEMDTNTLILKSLKLTDNISDNVPTELTENMVSLLNVIYAAGLPLNNLPDNGTRTQIMTIDSGALAAGQKVITIDNVNDVVSLVVTPFGGPVQEAEVDYELLTDNGADRILSWSGLGLEETLALGDKLLLQYSLSPVIVLGAGEFGTEEYDSRIDGGTP